MQCLTKPTGGKLFDATAGETSMGLYDLLAVCARIRKYHGRPTGPLAIVMPGHRSYPFLRVLGALVELERFGKGAQLEGVVAGPFVTQGRLLPLSGQFVMFGDDRPAFFGPFARGQPVGHGGMIGAALTGQQRLVDQVAQHGL